MLATYLANKYMSYPLLAHTTKGFGWLGHLCRVGRMQRSHFLRNLYAYRYSTGFYFFRIMQRMGELSGRRAAAAAAPPPNITVVNLG